MFKTIYQAFLEAIENIRTNFFHTLLSVIGITIGVSALIVILSMIDGLEEYAQNQISTTTSVKVVEVSSVTNQRIDGVLIDKEDPVYISSGMHRRMTSGITVPYTTFRVSEVGRQVATNSDSLGALVYYSDKGYTDKYELLHGTHLFEPNDDIISQKVTVVDTVFARRVVGENNPLSGVIGSTIRLDTASYQITGIVYGYSQFPEVLVPIDYLTGQELEAYPPFVAIEANEVEDVPEVKKAVNAWLEGSPYSPEEIRIISQDGRVSQATRGFQLFRVIMGLIVGISVLVGGIGVMNVLLISVTQRTKEIGLRKAVGSRKKDIYIQFLSESMVVSLFGTLVGICFGVIVSLAVVPVVHAIVEIQFSPTFSPVTITLITIFSMIVGMLFGTFPAYKASQLSPIDALRTE